VCVLHPCCVFLDVYYVLQLFCLSTSICVCNSFSIAGVPLSQALPGFLITAPPSVCVPAVLGALAVWIQNQKNINTSKQHPCVQGPFWSRLVKVVNTESWRFPRWLCWRLVLGNLGCSKKRTKNKLVDRSWENKRSEVSVMFGLSPVIVLYLPPKNEKIIDERMKFHFKGTPGSMKKRHGNQKISHVERWLRAWAPRAWWKGAQIRVVLKPKPIAHKCLFCHIYCALLGTSWDAIVGASCAVSNRDLPYLVLQSPWAVFAGCMPARLFLSTGGPAIKSRITHTDGTVCTYCSPQKAE